MARRRSERAHQDVLKAALQLFAERGIDRTSMDAIAETSGVSKATIYKHWADKEELLLEAMAHLSGLRERPAFDSANTRADLIAVLAHKPPRDRARMQKRIMPHFIAYALNHPKFGQTWRRMVTQPPREQIIRLLKSGVEKGELAPGLDYVLGAGLLLGPMLYFHILKFPEARAPKDLPREVVDAFWRAFKSPT
ncbi:MAG TPA: TetR/AcrR family transcriptional regulator [Bryobacteraceae bacterium]